MATTIEHKEARLEQEDLDAEFAELKREMERDRHSAGTAQLFAFFAVLLAMSALLVAVLKEGNGSNEAANVPMGGAMGNAGAMHGTAGMMQGSSATAAGATGGSGLPAKEVTLTIKPDFKPGSDGARHDAFLPRADFTVKAGQTVRVTVLNYDDMPHSFTSPALGAGAAVPAAQVQMQGTPQDIKMMPGPGLGVDQNIPAGTESAPSKTTFTFTAPKKPGRYAWWCKLPCDPWAMTDWGYMKGHVTVTHA